MNTKDNSNSLPLGEMSVGQRETHILIIGAGLCGSLLALRLGQRGYKITLVEKRPDLRTVTQDAGRSINLALSDRGFTGLRLAGVEEKARELCIPMYGRMIHDAQGNSFLSKYSGREKEYINSISRPGLNAMLLDEAQKLDNVNILFNKACTEVDLENANATFKDYNSKQEQTLSADAILATDGAGSVVRKAMFSHKKFLFSFSQDWLSHGYKELEIPATATGDYKIEKNALHIWPRGADMLIALPNLDGSFTVTLFAPYQDDEFSFANFTSREKVLSYFKSEYPDALELMPNLVDQFFENPTAPLGTIKCRPWSGYGKTCLLGDSAHAIVPFYGQGMNASFEDVVVFDKTLDEYGDQGWEIVFKQFEKARKPDTDAIADLAVDNFHEMKEHSAHPMFQEKRKLETAFEKEFPELYYSKYSLVTFNEHIGYREAMIRGRAQNKAILNLLDDGLLPDTLSLKAKLKLVQDTTAEILHNDKVGQL